MSLQETILSIKREFTGVEKYRLFLLHLDNVENELRELQKLYNVALKTLNENSKLLRELNRTIETRNGEIALLKESLDEYQSHPENNPIRFVKIKTHNRMIEKSRLFESRFWDVCRENKELKEKLERYEKNS